MKNNALILISLLSACTPLSQSSTNQGNPSKILRHADFAYEAQVSTVVIRPASDDPSSFLYPAVTELGTWDLRLEFDELNAAQDYYYLRIVHCNRDWTPSNLPSLDFMTSYNEFPITDAQYSVDTHIPYIHYQVNLPPVKIPGNYLAVVYRGTDKDDIVLSKRFMVYDNRVTFEGEGNLIGAGRAAALNQQINFTVNYKNIEVINPMENLNVTILQNHRWDNMAVDIRPSFIREIEKEVEYRFFDPEKMFKGGNEFRYFDLRSLLSPGRNVARVNRAARPVEVFIEPDKSRAHEVYAQYEDYNGNFIIDNLDYGTNAFANYAWVNFTLASKPLPAQVYVTGEFNYWNLNERNVMTYDSAETAYRARILLKQGWYDYQYRTESASLPALHVEGSHFETENFYEILVYYRPFQPNADLLIGYLLLEKNRR